MFSFRGNSDIEYANNLELPTIIEKEPLQPQRTKDASAIRNKKDIISMGSTSSIPGLFTKAARRGRSKSVPFIRKALPIGNNETYHIFFDKLIMTLSGLYCKMLVVLGMCFPVAEVLSAHVPTSFYETFYFYLFSGSMTFLTFIYLSLLKERNLDKKTALKKIHENCMSDDSKLKISQTNSRYGSFYLRMGAAAFGIGSMIYAGLEFGQYFELVENVKCSNVLMAVTPALRMVFIVFQLQFIFVTDNQKPLKKFKDLSRFGLMHMIATNLCVWLNVLVQETKHEILNFYSPNVSVMVAVHKQYGVVFNPWANRLPKPDQMFNGTLQENNGLVNTTLHRVVRGLRRPQELYECRRANIMGSLVQNAAPFLFPCTIEYSLICAVILYALWKSIGEKKQIKTTPSVNRVLKPVMSYTNQYFTVDCANAHKGLFASIIVIVFTIISLIMFFALIKVEEYASTAVFQVNLCELTLYILSTLATILAMYKIKDLKYESERQLELDNILLVMAQTGLYMYFMFSLIAGYFTKEIFRRPNIFITAVFGIIQSSFQTMFIVDAWWRRCTTTKEIKEKPARQLVTFLLLTNIAMWAINHLENARADFHPIELRFYGVWAWTIITHLSMPLAVFYRFHSSVCLCEIWKCTYKMRLLQVYKENEIVPI